MIILLNQYQKLDHIATIVSLIVIALMAITFGILFLIYYHYYSKCIANDIENATLKKEIVKENKKYFKEVEVLMNDSTIHIKEIKEKLIPLKTYVEKQKNTKPRKTIKIISNVFLCIFYLFFVCMLIAAVYIKSSGDVFSLLDTSCLVIKSGSMEEKNEKNTYLFENNLNNQISTYELITIQKVKEDELQLYDIVAFKNSKNEIIVHRIIQVYQENDEVFYMTRGDANDGSASYEIKIKYEDIIGRYTGYHNFYLGVFIYYFQSGIGLITLSFALILVGFYEILDSLISKRIKRKKSELYARIDQDILSCLTNATNLSYLPIDFTSIHLEDDNKTSKNKTMVRIHIPPLNMQGKELRYVLYRKKKNKR